MVLSSSAPGTLLPLISSPTPPAPLTAHDHDLPQPSAHISNVLGSAPRPLSSPDTSTASHQQHHPPPSAAMTPSSSPPANSTSGAAAATTSEDVSVEEARPPYLHAMLAGGLGGTSGDMLMHSLDTVKTRQQGDPHVPPRYTSLASSYYKIARQEGVRRGLYGGWLPALLGSFPGTVIFFGTYEWSKRHMVDAGVQPHLAYLSAGFLADAAASVVYVPSEVLKTRLQLQGRYDNPYFRSGYNYRGTADAVRTIVGREGFGALFYGYKATLYRDMPFSALQFMFYEQARRWARAWSGGRDDIGWRLELLTGAAAGGLAGIITCPLDVVKTRLQTQVNPAAAAAQHHHHPEPFVPAATAAPVKGVAPGKEGHVAAHGHVHGHAPADTTQQQQQKRLISTSSPSTHLPKHGAVALETSSVYTGLKVIYKTEGVGGWFRGVGPRAAWTSIQSSCMLFLYQTILRQLEVAWPMERPEMGQA